MALFSRRPKNSDDDSTGAVPPQGGAQTPDAVAPDVEPSVPAEPVPHVGISVSTFGSVSAATSRADTPAAPAPAIPPGATPARPAHLASPAAEASSRVETVPGLRDNVLLRDALAALPAQAQPTEMINVARQLLQGHVYIRVQGDARELLAQGKSLPTSMVTFKDEKYMLVYSGGAALQDAIKADGDAGTSALAQSVLGLLQQVVAGPMGGVAIDHASRPGSALLPKQLIEKALADLDPAQRIKSLLAGKRTSETADDVAVAMTEAPLWIAARRSDDGQVGIAELRTPDGARLLEVFSHPLELLALGRGDQAVKVEPAQLAKALRGDTGLSGVVVDPAGPWIRLTRDQLHPLLIVGA
ncbi:SseB family protein [Microbacterium sp. cx-59]|uniref:SseB family protein n=1 Tax=Microbacterium sp. cx-59 TaxID=2891207 RepID=UPI001E3C4F6B|nr:SseB family protein [Microbacterium sp. cx-59]MCC4907968.1 SseB family protein [Microbacterium sp. cx-59]